jgi:hypothetical protein
MSDILQSLLTTIGNTRPTNRTAGDSKLPRIELPGTTGWRDIHFVNALGAALAQKDIYTRSTLIFYINIKRRCIEPLTPVIFKTWAERHVVFFKPFTDPDTGAVSQKEMSMTKEHAETALCSPDFQSHLRTLAHVNTIPLPAFTTTGQIHLLQPGYDPTTRNYTFPDIH